MTAATSYHHPQSSSLSRPSGVASATSHPLLPSTPSSSSGSSSPWIRKPLSVVHQQEAREAMQFQQQHNSSSNSDNNNNNNHGSKQRRHLSLWDLIMIGVGSSVGSGIFVLTGEIASQTTGPLTFVSFLISGMAACLSGTCYAELSGRIPAAGSTYVYAYVCLGELAAVVAASCLTLEYGIAGAAVARSWGDKVVLWLEQIMQSHGTATASSATDWLQLGPGGFINLPAGFISIASTLLLLLGVSESKAVTNFFTALKLVLVASMTIGGYAMFQRSNMIPLAPYGWKGVMRGATSSFFAYLGYDEVCCVAGEAIDPARTMPLAVLGTLVIVTFCYVFSALALTGMLDYTLINPTSGFPDAFLTRGAYWASQITSLGELVCLPVVVLVSLMAQPRLALSMSHDGLLPRLFSKLDSDGNLFQGTIVCGALMTLIATFMPFAYLNDLISAGILVAFSMTDSCLVLLRCESPPHRPHCVEQCLVLYNASCLITALLWSHDFWFLAFQPVLAILATATMLASLFYLASQCPCSAHFGGSILHGHHHGQGHHPQHGHIHHNHFDNNNNNNKNHFQTPLVPYLPCLGMAVNWYLVAQLEARGLFLLVAYLGVTIFVYLKGCAHHSHGHNHYWTYTANRQYYESIVDFADADAGTAEGAVGEDDDSGSAFKDSLGNEGSDEDENVFDGALSLRPVHGSLS